MIPFLDTPPVGFLVVTVFLGCGASFLMGQALASTWRPHWQLFVYSAILGLADRFLNFALFEGLLLSPTGYVSGTVLIFAMAVFAYRVTRARMMVRQYPWLYARTGLFSWRRIDGAS